MKGKVCDEFWRKSWIDQNVVYTQVAANERFLQSIGDKLQIVRFEIADVQLFVGLLHSRLSALLHTYAVPEGKRSGQNAIR